MGKEGNTKSTSRIYVGEDLLDKLVVEERKRRLIGLFETVKKRFYEITDGEEWVRIENKEVYYIDKYRMLIADTTRKACPRDRFDPMFAGYSGRLISFNEAKDLFYENKFSNQLVDSSNNVINYEDKKQVNRICYGLKMEKAYTYSTPELKTYYLKIENGSTEDHWGVNDCIKIPVYSFNEERSRFMLFICENLVPSKLQEDEKKIFECLSNLSKEGNLTLSPEDEYTFNESFINEQFVSEVLSGKHDELNGISFRKPDIIEYIKSKKLELTTDIRKAFQEKYLKSDYDRAEIDPYDSNILEDIERGHWDLWEGRDPKGTPVEITDSFIARNPSADIQPDGIVGIDFGTKSTVVVCQNGDDRIQPMRVGRGKYKREIQKDDYENPTVMEFRNIENFMNCYRAKAGRPETLWEDLAVSHTAAEQLKGTQESSQFYSFFSELKQWCGDRSRMVRIVDNQGHEETLRPFLDIEEGGFDPIELYAYYLGLYINNMRQKIYMNYLLSFPVTYEKAVKEKIVESFERGLKKSLPEPVLEDEESMKGFRVCQHSSEPAAYAVCALKEYGFEPEEKEKIFYGIFDFGGGTTDFDFGIWRRAEAKSRRRYDYVIKHFGAGGDQYLGGENLLEMMAFHVFKQNKKALLQAGIPFYKPHDCKTFVGSEDLLYDSQEARLNIKQLMEKLRGLWQEDDEEAIQAIEEGELKIQLFTKEGKAQPNFGLSVDREELKELLRTRIEQGVKNFFAAMVQTFSKDDLDNAKKINIFLAGNSSKSQIVKDLFEQYSQQCTQMIRDKFKKEVEKEGTDSFFCIYPPLGTEEALKIQGRASEEEKKEEADSLTRPTGKTGVAFGLILGKPGSRIKIESEISSEKEVKFKYYIGYNEDGYFQTILDRDTEYNIWEFFIDAFETDFEFYYTSLPEESFNKSPVAGIRKKLCRIDHASEDENVGIYIRAVAPTVVEYAVATEEGIQAGEFIEAPKQVELA